MELVSNVINLYTLSVHLIGTLLCMILIFFANKEKGTDIPLWGALLLWMFGWMIILFILYTTLDEKFRSK